MGRRTDMATVAIVFGLIVQILLGGAEDRVRTILFGYTAQRIQSGGWDFQTRTAGNSSWPEQPRLGVNVQVSETEHSNVKEKGNWIEVITGVHVNTYPKNFQKLPPEAVTQKTSWPAPSDYEQIAGLGYYKVHRESVQWETARRRCVKEGAHLLVINSALEAAAVVGTSGLSDWIWIGFDDFSTEGEFVTLHGTTLEEAGYAEWAQDEPERGPRCGVVNQDGRLGTGTCKLMRKFICEFHSPDEHVQETRNPSLPVGYRAVGNLGHYRVHRDRAKWETARRRCEAEGAHLAVPNTEVEAAAVLRPSGLPGWFWVGFDDFDNYGTYVNFDGQQLWSQGVYSTFAPDEPDESIHCGVARTDAKLGTGTCKLEREYLCELYKPNEKPTKKPPAASPPAGYVALGSTSYYKVHKDKAPWEKARRRCEDEGAHLLVVNSQAEADAVLKTSGLPSWFWLGFDDFDAPGEYVYLDGTRLVDSGYVHWASGEPDENLNCGIADTDGLLGTGTCKVNREYICEWEIPSSPPVPSPYPRGYHKIGGLGVYKVHRDRVAWETARRSCASEGAHLVVVNSEQEAKDVLGTSGLPSWFWVGFDDFDNGGIYVTLHGTTLDNAGYNKWSPGEPDEDLSCGVAKVDGLLGTGTCSVEREYICELNI